MMTSTTRTLVVLLLAIIVVFADEAKAASLDVEDLDNYAFVASRNTSEIAVISTSDDKLVGALDLKLIPDQLVISKSHRKLAATHGFERQLSIIDLDQGIVTTVIDLGFHPAALQIDDDTGVVAIADPANGTLAMISLGAEKHLFSIDKLDHLTDLMFDRHGEHLFVAHGHRGAISVVDARSGEMGKPINLSTNEGIVELVRTPGGKTGLALHGNGGLVSALNLDDKVEIRSTRLSGPVHRGFPTANSQYFLLPIGAGETVSMVSSWTHRESERLPGIDDMVGMNFAMFDSVAFALGRKQRAAKVVSLLETPRTTLIPLPGHPETGLTVELGTKVYVALSDTNQIAIIDAIGKKFVGVIDDVGDEPWAITAAGGLGYCH